MRRIADRFGGRAFLMNDANACALAEWQFGAGRGTRHMIFFISGTGMGGGLILNGDLYEGATDDAGEIGHVRMRADGRSDPARRVPWRDFEAAVASRDWLNR